MVPRAQRHLCREHRYRGRKPACAPPRTTTGAHLSVAQVCAELGVARSTFYDWRAAKKAPPCMKLPNGDIRVRRVDFHTWLASLQESA